MKFASVQRVRDVGGVRGEEEDRTREGGTGWRHKTLSSLKLFAAYVHICTCFLACKGARAHTNTHMNALPTLTHSLTSGPLVRRFLAFARGRSPSIYYTMERSVNGCNRDACSKKDSRSKKDDSHHCNILL